MQQSHIFALDATDISDEDIQQIESPSIAPGVETDESHVEFTAFTTDGGCLSKRISLGADGSVVPDGSACVMSRGSAQRTIASDVHKFAAWIGGCGSDQALALGRLRVGIADEVTVTTKHKLDANPGAIARSSDFLGYRPGAPAFCLIDYDLKAMPVEVKDRIEALGGFWSALVSVVPELANVARVVRASTSTGLWRRDTDEALTGSGGLHVYVLVKDGADIDRFLRTLHERCWLAGLGWHMLGAGGQLLERSIVDKMVGAPERLVFEGAPILVEPVGQKLELRRPQAFEGNALNSADACPLLSIVEKSNLKQMIAKSAVVLAPESAKSKAKFVEARAVELAARVGVAVDTARATIERQTEGVLLPDVVLPFDDVEFKDCTVADVLADPEKFEGATLADPQEGIPYGRCKAKIYRRSDGAPWIRSFAHGFKIYELKHDARSVRAAIAGADATSGTGKWIKLVANADIADDDEQEIISDLAEKFPKVGKRVIAKQIKDAKKRNKDRGEQDKHDRKLAERKDPRPRILAPKADAEWLPTMSVLNEVLGSSKAKHPPARDGMGHLAVARRASIPNMHAFSAVDANDERQDSHTSLPAPEQWTMCRLSEAEASETIERHIEHYDFDTGLPVHLPGPFVRHFMQRTDGALPTINGVSTMPLVLGDGSMFAIDGLDRENGIDYHITPEVLAFIPKATDINDDAVRRAMKFLLEEWLCDVLTDFTGKCTLISCGMSIIERVILPERPAYFIVAGRRGCGKTTAIMMMIRAVTGMWPSATAWSTSDEERKKSLLAYLMGGASYILWDNVARGVQISCPHIEASLTSPTITGRILGVTESASPAATAIQIVTGNNVGAKGDMASRSLHIRLEADRHDPENRKFKHPNPIEWTDQHRGEILRALYTILLGNPQLRKPRDEPGETRFKIWWRLVGSAVEHGAKLVDDKNLVRFKDLFLEGEEEDADSLSLGDALDVMKRQWPDRKEFSAEEVTRFLKTEEGSALCDFLFPDPGSAPNKLKVTRLLAGHVGNPVRNGDQELTLRSRKDGHTKNKVYWVNAYATDDDRVASNGAEGISRPPSQEARERRQEPEQQARMNPDGTLF